VNFNPPGPGKGLCRRLVLFPLILSAAISGCSAQDRLESRDLVIEREGAPPVALRAEIARSAEERARGLMYRKELPDGEGMLFVFERDQILHFWMKDTLIPLSIAFIDAEGRILEIRHMESGDLRTVSSSRSARYALEVPQYWFSRAGVGPGDRIGLDFF
jgi:uncharacterized membrane protein (UPF0127 family)